MVLKQLFNAMLTGYCCLLYCYQAERAALEKAVDEEIAAEAAADEEAKQRKREQIAQEEERLLQLEQQRAAEVTQALLSQAEHH